MLTGRIGEASFQSQAKGHHKQLENEIHRPNRLSAAIYLLQHRGVVLKKKWGRLKQDRQRFVNNLGLHARTLIHVRKIATADLWSCPAIQLLVFECL